ncbi:MAG: hypothetical protein OXQ99_17065 [Chloroflexota bacterium]|nr:hypothetical protein [Chloroflexota bacterium]
MSVTSADRQKCAALKQKDSVPEHVNLTAEQQELLHDMRVSLKQMKRGELLPARETLREIDLELEAEDNARTSDA